MNENNQAPRLENFFHAKLTAEHEILNVHKYKNIRKFGLFRLRESWNAFFHAHEC